MRMAKNQVNSQGFSDEDGKNHVNSQGVSDDESDKKNDFMMLMMQPVKQKVLHWQPLEGLPG